MIPPSRTIPPQPNPRPNPPPKIAGLETVAPATVALEIGERATGELATAARVIAVLATVGPAIANTGYSCAAFARLRQSGLVLPYPSSW